MLEVKETWDDTQRGIAFDLLGVHPALRDGFRRVPEPSNKAGLAALVEREVDRLRDDLTQALDELDHHEQILAASGMPLHEDSRTARLRKYETAIKREWKQAHDELLNRKAESAAAFDATLPPAFDALREAAPRSTVTDAVRDYLFHRAEAHQSTLIQQMIDTMDALQAEAEAESETETEIEAESRTEPAEEVRRIEPTAPAPIAPPVFRGNRRQRRAEQSRARRASASKRRYVQPAAPEP